MFVDTVSASELRENLKDSLSKVRGKEALQVTHRDGTIRVMITQEHFLSLVTKLAAYEGQAGPVVSNPTADDILKKVQAKLEQMAGREKDL